MLWELFQLYLDITGQSFYYLPIHFLVFVVMHLAIVVITSRGSITYSSLRRSSVKVSVVVAEYGEDPEVFELVMRSIAANKPDEIVVVHDDNNEEIARIAGNYGARVISLKERVGKKKALTIGWEEASGDIVVHVDSDTIIASNAIEEIVKPFEDPRIVGVQGRSHVFRAGSWLAWRLSVLIEAGRDLVNRSLKQGLIVVDGRFNAWRRGFLLRIKDEFLQDRFLGVHTIIGDDRLLTWLAHRRGYITAYQPSAVAVTKSPENMWSFVGQQLRWARSGYMFFAREVLSGNCYRMGALYNVHMFLYYLSPFSFTLALIHDMLMTGSHVMLTGFSSIDMILIVFISIVGSSLISYMRRIVLGMWRVTVKELLATGFVGLFVMYPLMIYSVLTIRRQGSWITR